MVELEGNYINLRPLVLEDLAFLYTIENDESLWELSQVQTPFSKDVLQTYLETAHNDIKLLKQLRLVITSKTNEPIGFIDLFDFDAHNKHAGVSIVLTEPYREKGYGKDALSLLMDYSFKDLGLYQLYSNILEGNTASIRLFESVGFEKVGLKKNGVSLKDAIKMNIYFNL